MNQSHHIIMNVVEAYDRWHKLVSTDQKYTQPETGASWESLCQAVEMGRHHLMLQKLSFADFSSPFVPVKSRQA